MRARSVERPNEYGSKVLLSLRERRPVLNGGQDRNRTGWQVQEILEAQQAKRAARLI